MAVYTTYIPAVAPVLSVNRVERISPKERESRRSKQQNTAFAAIFDKLIGTAKEGDDDYSTFDSKA